MSRLRIAVIGAGMAFEPHARVLLELQDRIELACVVCRTAEKRDAVLARFGFATAGSVAEVAGDPAIDAAIVLTPPASHLEVVRALAESGKHILLEKPLEVSVDAARAVVDVCEQNKVFLGVVLQHRFRRAAAELHKLVTTGALGALQAVFVSIPWWRPQSYYDEPGRGTYARDGGGVLLTQAIHTIDLVQYLAGPVQEVYAHALTSAVHRMEAEDLVAATLKFAGGAVGTLAATTACYPGYSEQIRIIGEKGSACLEGDTLQVALLDGTTLAFGAAGVLGGGADPMAFSHATHKALIEHFAHSVAENVQPVPGGREALAVQLLIDAMLQSARKGAAVRIDGVAP